MPRIMRRAFVGSRTLLFLLLVFPLAVPFGILYLLEGLVTVEEEIEGPEKFLESFRSGRIGK